MIVSLQDIVDPLFSCTINFNQSRKNPSLLSEHLSIRSVPSPIEQSYIIYRGGGNSLVALHNVLTYTNTHAGLSGQLGAVSLIQSACGCRIQETLGLLSSDIVLPDKIIIRALKQSRSRIVRLPELAESLRLHNQALEHRLFNLSYSQVYRAYKNAGIMSYHGKGKSSSVTHSYRLKFINSVHRSSNDLDTTRDIVGHKSSKSTLIYLSKGDHNG